jgi:hypothetical protein
MQSPVGCRTPPRPRAATPPRVSPQRVLSARMAAKRLQQAVNQLLHESFDTLEVRACAAIWAVHLLDDALDPDGL